MAREQAGQKHMAFVSDWQERSTNRQTRFNTVLIVALILAFAATAFSFFWSKDANQELILENNIKYLQVCGIQEADRVEDTLEEGMMMISNLAGRYASMAQLLPDTTVRERLSLMVDDRLFDRIGYVTPEGIDTTMEGITNVSDRTYFLKGMQGESGYDFLTSSRITGRPCVIFYAPVFEQDVVSGMMIGFYEMPRLDSLFSVQVYSYSPETYLLLSDGTVVANSNHARNCENMLDMLSDRDFQGQTQFADVQQAITHSSRASVTFEFISEDGEPTVGVVTQLQNCDWIILTMLPGSVSSTMIQRANRIGRILMLGISSVFIFLIAVIFLVITHYGRITKEEMLLTKTQLRRAIAHEQQQSFIVDTLAATFSSAYLIDLPGASYLRIEEQQATSLEAIPECGWWPDAVALYVARFVDEPYKDAVAQFLDAEKFQEVIGDKDGASMEFMRSDGGWRKIFLLPARRGEDGQLLSVLFAIQRIDEQKQKELMAQKALQEAFAAAQFASNAKTAFLSNMSHDIRTPMNAITGMTMIAAANIDDRSKVSDCLQKISASCRHLLGLINEILDMSKIESGKVDLSEEAFSLSTLLEDLVSMNQVLVREKNHTLTVCTDTLVHPNVIGDRTRLQQVFTNLLTNAIKYTPAGGKLEIILSEDTTSVSPVGKYLATFRDNGIGMSEEFQKTMFEPFSRAKDSRISGIQGTGLGMPIARNIIRMMNGDIKVESKLNEGSCFRVSFLLKLQPEDVPQPDPDSGGVGALPETDLSGIRILLAEDNELNMEIALELLSMLGLEIDTAENGKEAVDKFTASPPGTYDLIFMDVQMPVMNGYEATGAIRASSHPQAKTIPIVAMTANAFSSDVRAALEAGMDGHVAKPIDLGNIVKTVEKFVKKAGEHHVNQ